MRLPLSEMTTPRLVRRLHWWQRARGDRAMPRRVDLDPADLVDILPCIILIDIGRAGDGTPRFTFRLAGTHVEEHFRAPLRGWRVRDLPLWPGDLKDVYGQFLGTLREACPTYHVQDYETRDGWHVRYECLLAPMTRYAGLDMLIGAVSFLASHRSLHEPTR